MFLERGEFGPHHPGRDFADARPYYVNGILRLSADHDDSQLQPQPSSFRTTSVAGDLDVFPLRALPRLRP